MYKNREFDKEGNLKYTIAEESYYPSNSDKDLYTESEIESKKQKHTIKIIEYNYTYY